MSRTRTRRVSAKSGMTYRNGVYTNWADHTAHIETCTDVVSAGDGHVFRVLRRSLQGGKMNKSFNPGRTGNGAVDYTCEVIRSQSPLVVGHIALADSPGDSAVAARVLAATNPSRPTVDLPVALLELKDFPQLFRSAGETFLKKLAGANLKYQFGIKPLASDLANLMLFADIVNKRLLELQRLQERGLRRTIRIGSYSSTYTKIERINSVDLVADVQLTKTTTEEVSGFVKWYPTGTFPVDLTELSRVARRAALGLTIDFNTAWNLIPWSWLVDWCTSTGDFFLATRNIVPSSHSTVEVMRKTVTHTVWPFTRYSGSSTISAANIKVDEKSRQPASPSPFSAHEPVLSSRQMSILGSIGLLSGNSRVAR